MQFEENVGKMNSFFSCLIIKILVKLIANKHESNYKLSAIKNEIKRIFENLFDF